MMRLADALQLTIRNRDSWNTGSGAVQAVIAAKRCIDVLGPDFDCSKADGATFVLLQRELKKQVSRYKKPFSPATINRSVSAMRVMLSEMHYAGLLNQIPSAKQLKESSGRLAVYTKEQIDQMIAMAFAKRDPEMANAIQFAYLTGCRKSELLNLRRGDIDLINKELSFVKTKNGKDHVLPIGENLFNLLAPLCETLEDVEPLFYADNPSAFYARFIAIRDACGIDSDHVFHTIRHTTGTTLVTNGVPLRAVMGVLNHSSVTMTLRYAHATLDSKADALSLL